MTECEACAGIFLRDFEGLPEVCDGGNATSLCEQQARIMYANGDGFLTTYSSRPGFQTVECDGYSGWLEGPCDTIDTIDPPCECNETDNTSEDAAVEDFEDAFITWRGIGIASIALLAVGGAVWGISAAMAVSPIVTREAYVDLETTGHSSITDATGESRHSRRMQRGSFR